MSATVWSCVSKPPLCHSNSPCPLLAGRKVISCSKPVPLLKAVNVHRFHMAKLIYIMISCSIHIVLNIFYKIVRHFETALVILSIKNTNEILRPKTIVQNVVIIDRRIWSLLYHTLSYLTQERHICCSRILRVYLLRSTSKKYS